jgi:hypothetical protein
MLDQLRELRNRHFSNSVKSEQIPRLLVEARESALNPLAAVVAFATFERIALRGTQLLQLVVSQHFAFVASATAVAS